MNKDLELLLDKVDEELNYKLRNNTVRDLFYFTNNGSFVSEEYASLSLFDIIVLAKIDFLLDSDVINIDRKRELINLYYEYKKINEKANSILIDNRYINNSFMREELLSLLDKSLIIMNELNEYKLLKSFSIKNAINDNCFNKKIDKVFKKK